MPRVVVGALRKHLVPYRERLNSLSGDRVWPHDRDQKEIIDWISPRVVGRSPNASMNEMLRKLHFDAFLAFIDQLIRTFPDDAYGHALYYAQQETDSSRIFNLIQILREFDGFDDQLELPISARCDQETLWELYADFIAQSLSEESYWQQHTLWEIEGFHEVTEINAIEIDEIEFTGGEGITFDALVHFDVSGSTDDGEYGESGRDTFTYRVSGYLDAPLRAGLNDVTIKR